MAYTKEQLLNFSVAKLVDIIMSQQEQIDPLRKALQQKKDALRKISVLCVDTEALNETNNISEGAFQGSILSDLVETRGRKGFTPEEKALAYERQKERQRLQYRQKREEYLNGLAKAKEKEE